MSRSTLPVAILFLIGLSAVAHAAEPHLGAAEQAEKHMPGTWLNWVLSLRVGGHQLFPNEAWVAFFWGLFIILMLTIFSVAVSRRLKIRAGRGQLFLETIVQGIGGLLESVLGPRAVEFLPFIGSLFIYIASMNLLGMIPGFLSPTSNLNMTAGLAMVSFCVIHYTGFRESGLGYLKHFVEGVPLSFSPKVTAILSLLALIPVAVLVLVSHLVTAIFLPVTLAMRLYGNIMGEERVVESLIELVVHSPARWIPVQLPNMLLGIVTSVVQAIIFSMLTAVFISLVLHKKHEHEGIAEAA